MANGKGKNDFDLNSFSVGDDDFNDLFDEDFGESSGKKGKQKSSIENDSGFSLEDIASSTPEPPARKRTAKDFEPDMDALLMTAQSSMIIEGIKHYQNKNYASETLQAYIEAQKGVELYIKILNRHPENYMKLKTLIDSDIDCQKVEMVAFNLFKQTYNDIAETADEKIKAFELLHNLLKESVQKAAITNSNKKLKRYYLISGGIDRERVMSYLRKGDLELKTDIKEMHTNVKLALDLLKRGNIEIAAGMKGKDLNIYILNASEFLRYVYELQGNQKISDYYRRINTIHKKYFIVQE